MNETIKVKSPERIEWSNRLRIILTNVLNEVHNTEFQERFWALLLEDHIRAVITRKEILEEEDLVYIPERYPINAHHFPSKKERLKNRIKLFLKYVKSRGRGKEIANLLKSADRLRIGFPEFNGLSTEETGKPLPEYYPLLEGNGDKKKRYELNEIASGFEDKFTRNVLKRLPEVYIELFRIMYNRIDLFRPEAKNFHVHNIRTYYDRLLVAKYVAHGSRLIWYQHGSHYGEYQHEYMHHLEHSVSDEFRTWGWKILEKDVPWKAYRLEKFRKEYSQYSGSKEYDLLLCYPKMYAKYKEHCLEVTDYLLVNLDFNKYQKVMARPRPLHKKHSHEEELSFIGDDRIIISSGLDPISQEVSKSKLVIQLNVPGTNFLECIYSNHPTMGLLTNDQPTEIAKPYYDFLLKEGVLHNNISSLTGFLNKVDLDKWWKNLTVKQKYKDFKNTFCKAAV